MAPTVRAEVSGAPLLVLLVALCCLGPLGTTAKGHFGSPYRLSLYSAPSPPVRSPPRHRNWCAHVVTRTISCAVINGTDSYVKAERRPCSWPKGKCQRPLMYRTYLRPHYKLGYKTVSEIEWRCCPGFGGDSCLDRVGGAPPPSGSVPGAGFVKGVPTGGGPFKLGGPAPKVPGAMVPGPPPGGAQGDPTKPGFKPKYPQKSGRPLMDIYGERIDRLEDAVRRVTLVLEQTQGSLVGMTDGLRASLHADARHMIQALVGGVVHDRGAGPPHGEAPDSIVGFEAVPPDHRHEVVPGGDKTPGMYAEPYPDVMAKVVALREDLRERDRVLAELQATVAGQAQQIQRLADRFPHHPPPPPPPPPQQQFPHPDLAVLDSLLGDRILQLKGEIFNGVDERMNGHGGGGGHSLCSCDSQLALLEQRAQRAQLALQQHVNATLSAFHGELQGVRTDADGAAACCAGATATLDGRLADLERGVLGGHAGGPGDIQGAVITGEVVALDARLNGLEARINASDPCLPEHCSHLRDFLSGLVAGEAADLKSQLERTTLNLEVRIADAARQQPPGGGGGGTGVVVTTGGAAANGTDTAGPQERGCCTDDNRVEHVLARLSVVEAGVASLNASMRRWEQRGGGAGEDAAEYGDFGAVQGEITLLKLNFSTINRTLRGLRDSVSEYRVESARRVNESVAQAEQRLDGEVQQVRRLLGEQASRLAREDWRVRRLQGQLGLVAQRVASDGATRCREGSQKRSQGLADGGCFKSEGAAPGEKEAPAAAALKEGPAVRDRAAMMRAASVEGAVMGERAAPAERAALGEVAAAMGVTSVEGMVAGERAVTSRQGATPRDDRAIRARAAMMRAASVEGAAMGERAAPVERAAPAERTAPAAAPIATASVDGAPSVARAAFVEGAALPEQAAGPAVTAGPEVQAAALLEMQREVAAVREALGRQGERLWAGVEAVNATLRAQAADVAALEAAVVHRGPTTSPPLPMPVAGFPVHEFHRAAFSAALTRSSPRGRVVAFDKTYVNDGQHYDPDTGIFRVPYDGRYFFSGTLVSADGQGVVAWLSAAGRTVAQVDTAKISSHSEPGIINGSHSHHGKDTKEEGVEQREEDDEEEVDEVEGGVGGEEEGNRLIGGNVRRQSDRNGGGAAERHATHGSGGSSGPGVFGVILSLSVGDLVFVEVASGEAASSDRPFTTFSGVLLYETPAAAAAGR
uniref:EMILIN-3-like n=1 Tax=Petromyzon marinus TaxID=7757 RepID=A0AAJ7TZG8_PETMA|nr:EMILIN-3-like [Petromyzon marinus]XP_032825855.1 EMILIN-3-like [Petromyzon marinus]